MRQRGRGEEPSGHPTTHARIIERVKPWLKGGLERVRAYIAESKSSFIHFDYYYYRSIFLSHIFHRSFIPLNYIKDTKKKKSRNKHNFSTSYSKTNTNTRNERERERKNRCHFSIISLRLIICIIHPLWTRSRSRFTITDR